MHRRVFIKNSLAAAAGLVLGAGVLRPMPSPGYLMEGFTITQQVSLSGSRAGSNLSIVYNSLPNNQPRNYGNHLALWQASSLPYGQAPLQNLTVDSDDGDGIQNFTQLPSTQVSYVVGYATSSDLNTVCSTLTFFPGQTSGVSFSTQVVLAEVSGDSSLVIQYFTPTGNLPETHRNWVGLWQGRSVPYTGDRMISSVYVSSNANTGVEVMDEVNLNDGQTYTLAYFMGPNFTDMAATCTFTLQD